MKTADPIESLREANPVRVQILHAEITADERRRMLERAIALGTAGAPALATGPVRTRRTRRRLLALAAASVAVAVAVAIVLAGSPVGPAQPAFAGAAVEVAESSPRLLVGAPGWSVDYVDQSNFSPNSGEVRFSNGQDDLEINWTRFTGDLPRPELTGPNAYLHELNQWYRIGNLTCAGVQSQSACRTYERNTEVPFLGGQALLNESESVYDDDRITHRFTLIRRSGDTDVTITGQADSREAFLDLTDTIDEVDVDTWLAAMPARIVKPLQRPEVVDQMLSDIPIPASIDVDQLRAQQSAMDRYHLGAEVTGAIACAWLDQWAAAVRSGDAASADEAVQAMSTSRNWAILQEMRDEGGWSQVVWEDAKYMEQGDQRALLPGGVGMTEMDGSQYELRPGYASGLGCASGHWVLIPGTAGTANGVGPPPTPVESPN